MGRFIMHFDPFLRRPGSFFWVKSCRSPPQRELKRNSGQEVPIVIQGNTSPHFLVRPENHKCAHCARPASRKKKESKSQTFFFFFRPIFSRYMRGGMRLVGPERCIVHMGGHHRNTRPSEKSKAQNTIPCSHTAHWVARIGTHTKVFPPLYSVNGP